MKATKLVPLALLLVFRVEENEVTFSFEINCRNHSNVFNYLSKMDTFPVLNPTVYRIQLVDSNENEFTVLYDECLSHFPAITNTGRAHYKLIRNNVSGVHEIQSVHSTCFIGGYFCLPTTSKVVITNTEKSRTFYEESITYNCPWIMINFCLKEIFFQRMAIMNGLENVFGVEDC